MYNDLIEHFPAVVALLGATISAVVYLFWRSFTRVENKLDKVCDSLGNVVTRGECNQRHTDLLGFVNAIVGVTNCKTCKGEDKDEIHS